MMERQEPGRRAIGREKFVEKVWAWKAESGGLITNQLRRLGCSCDWSRERFTMDEGLSAAVTKVFVELYRQGLIYRDKRLVNWDPRLQTAISDLEVQQIETQGKLWHFKYPIEQEARSGAAATGSEKISPIASSRSPRRGRRRCSATPASPSIRTTSATRTWSAGTPSCRWSGGR